jgi:hypothetical protein
MLACIPHLDLNVSLGKAAGRLEQGILTTAIILCCILGRQQATAQEIGKLYAPRPPAGYAFVRVALADPAMSAKIQIDSSEAPIGNTAVATRYRVVKADKPVRISVGDRMIEQEIIPLAERFSTVVVTQHGASWTGYMIDEGQSGSSDLKAQLRFFNLAARCEASLKVAGGPVIFEATPTNGVRARSINPVQAQLIASCNGQNSAFTLPQLHSGDHYSLFFTEGAAQAPGLSGQFDETEPYTGR